MLFAHSGTGSHGEQVAQAIDFDGTNDYLNRASDFTGNADGKTFTFSTWGWLGQVGSNQRIYRADTSNVYFDIYINTSQQIILTAKNAAGVTILSATVTSLLPVANTFANILISVDLANASNRSAYITDVAASVTWTTYTNDSINFTCSPHAINDGGSTKGRFAHLYLDYTYRDLSNSANRRLFITADRKPAASGALITLSPIAYFKMDDPATAHVNSGTGGNMVLNGTIARSSRGPNQFNAAYSDLDGSADYLSRTAAPTGIVDGKQFTFHCVLNTDTIASSGYIAEFGSNTDVRFRVNAAGGTGNIAIVACNSAGTFILICTTSVALVAGRNYVLDASIDLSSTSKRHIAINGVVDSSVTWTTYTNDTIDFDIATTPRYRVGTSVSATNYFDGRLGEVFFHNSYIDLSVAANLAKFVTGTGIDAKPADLGANGELPLGTSPLIYCPMRGNDAGKNYGTGGDFTVNSGPFTGARGPNEFWGNKATFNGTTSVISKTSQLAGAADGKVFLLSFFVSKNASTAYTIVDTTGATCRVTINASNQLVIVAKNAGGSTILNATVTTTIANTTNTHALVSIDLANTSNRAVYLNNVSASVTWTTYTNDSIDFTVADFYVGSETGGSNKFAGSLAEFFFTTPAAYVDISQEATRLKYRDAFGGCVDLAANGSNPTGSQPGVYLRFDPAAFGTNAGSGGAFTASNITDGGQL